MENLRPLDYPLEGEDFAAVLAQIAVTLAEQSERGEIVAAAVHIAPHHRRNHNDTELLQLFSDRRLPEPTIKLRTPQLLRLTMRPRRAVRVGLTGVLKAWLDEYFLNAPPPREKDLIQEIADAVRTEIRALAPGDLPDRVVLTVFSEDCASQVLAHFGDQPQGRFERLRKMLPPDDSAKLTPLREFEIRTDFNDTTMREFRLQVEKRQSDPHYKLRLRWTCGSMRGSTDAIELSQLPSRGIMLGRDPRRDCVLDFSCISSRHLRIRRYERGGTVLGIELEDDHSANGTYLKVGDPQPMSRHFVQIGNSVTLVLGCGRVGGHDGSGQLITPESVGRRVAEPDRFGCVTVVVSLT